jgi:hypothetical protein
MVLAMPARVPATVLVVAGLDFLAWRWASGSHDTIAMVAGLTLVPLVILLLWTAVLAALSALLRVGQGAHRRLTTGNARADRAEGRGFEEAPARRRRVRARRSVRRARRRARRRRGEDPRRRVAA